MRSVRYRPKVSQIGPKLDKSGTFSDQISVYFGSAKEPKPTPLVELITLDVTAILLSFLRHNLMDTSDLYNNYRDLDVYLTLRKIAI